MTLELRQRTLSTPVGELRLLASAEALVAVYFDAHLAPELPRAPEDPDHRVLDRAATQLREYFEGSRRVFDVPLAPEGTAFQRQVWAALRDIPFGETRSYGELAASLDRPSASRAVGAANGRNPISVIVPCHRVIGSDGSLTGYAGGVERKRWLLVHEGSLGAELFASSASSAP